MGDVSQRPFDRSDNEFLSEVSRGHAAERAVAETLRGHGLVVDLPEQRVRSRFEDAESFNDGGIDIFVEGRPVQIKQRAGYAFSGPIDFPYPTVWVTTLSEWEKARGNHPRAYILVSSDLSGHIVVPYSLYGLLTFDTERYDPTRRATRRAVEIPTKACWTIGQFVNWALSGRVSGEPVVVEPPAPPPDYAAEVRAAYDVRPNGVGCRGCRAFTTDPTSLLDFAAFMHYASCTAMTPVEQISMRVDAVQSSLEAKT
jgi:hypothetical protein